MNKKQKKELKIIDDYTGIAPYIKEKLNKLDEDNEIKPHFSITPILYMLADNVPLNEKTYNEYDDEYGWV